MRKILVMVLFLVLASRLFGTARITTENTENTEDTNKRRNYSVNSVVKEKEIPTIKICEKAEATSSSVALNSTSFQFTTFGWQVGGVPVCAAPGSQWYATGIIDGSGGTISCWYDGRGSIYGQRLDSLGDPVWTVNGISLFDGANLFGAEVSLPAITIDTRGGAIIAANIGVNSVNGIYCQRVSGNGTKLWGVGGILVSSWYAGDDAQVQIFTTSDGAIITWSNQGDIYAQKVNFSGTPLWGDGVRIIDTAEQICNALAVTDGTGGAIIAAFAYSFRILAQRVDSTGTPLWGAGGVATGLNEFMLQIGVSYPKVVSDDSGGAIISTAGLSSAPTRIDIYAQRVDGNGTLVWGPNGIAVVGDSSESSQQGSSIKSDGSGGAILCWMDARLTGSEFHIYAQRINRSGDPAWTPGGVPVCTRSGNQYWPMMVYDWDGAVIIAWQEGYPENLYAQRLNLQDGSPMWMINGIPVITEPSRNILSPWGGYKGHLVASDTAIILFNDDRNGNFDIYAQIIPPRTVGIEEERVQRFKGARVQGFKISPNPFTSFTKIADYEKERFLIYDITGKLVGMDKGEQIGKRLCPGVYFIKPEGRDTKPLRIVKVHK